MIQQHRWTFPLAMCHLSFKRHMIGFSQTVFTCMCLTGTKKQLRRAWKVARCFAPHLCHLCPLGPSRCVSRLLWHLFTCGTAQFLSALHTFTITHPFYLSYLKASVTHLSFFSSTPCFLLFFLNSLCEGGKGIAGA